MNFDFLFNKIYDLDPPAVSLDLSDLSIKFIQLIKSGPEIKLKKFGSHKLPKGLIDAGEIKKKDELIKFLKNFFKKYKNTISNFAICNLPEQHTFMKVIQMPQMDLNRIKEAVGWQISDIFPLKLEEIYYDTQVVNFKNKKNKENKIDILVAASKKKLVDDYVYVLKETGFKIKRLEPESIAITRATVRKPKSLKPVLIVDWGATQITVIIYSEGIPKFTNSFQFDNPYPLTLAIAKYFNISLDKAEKMKIEIGLNKHIKTSHDILKAIEPVLNNVVLQIKKMIDYYDLYAHEHSQVYWRISKIILSGGESNLYGLTSYIKSKLGYKTKRANPLIKILKSPFKQSALMPYNVSLRYTTAIGLALSEFLNN